MMRKIIFVDIDGTLMGADQIIPGSAITACRTARKNGHLLYICSGRPFGDIPDEVKTIGFDGIISAGGARIDVGGKTIDRFFMDVETVAKIGDYLNACKEAFLFELSDSTVKNKNFEIFLKEARPSLTEKSSKEKIDWILHLFSSNVPKLRDDFRHDRVQKILFFGVRVSFTDMVARFGSECEICRCSIPFLETGGGEISPTGVHKGSALERVARHYGIPPGDTIAIGDSDNDRRMLESAGVGIAMGNADGALKAIAAYTTSSLEEDGFARAFQRYGLI
jgi:Cof subfamily protein (haloacid dehalogenase superfamily)